MFLLSYGKASAQYLQQRSEATEDTAAVAAAHPSWVTPASISDASAVW